MRREMPPSSVSNSRRERHQSRLAWDPDLEEAADVPPYILLIENWFPIRPRRRQGLIRNPVKQAVSTLGGQVDLAS